MIDRIETEHLLLRKAKDDDLQSIWHNVWSDVELARTMLWRPTETYEEALERLEKTKKIQTESYAYFVCLRDTDEPIGFGGIRETEPYMFEETGLCIARTYQKRGYGTEMLTALVDLAFRQLGGRCFRYGCFHDNIASAELCRKCGFVYAFSATGTRKWDGYEYLCDFYERKCP